MLQIKQDTYRRISDMVEDKKGAIVRGLHSRPGQLHVLRGVPPVPQGVPEITVSPRELSVHTAKAYRKRGAGYRLYDPVDSQRTSDTYIPIAREEIFLVLPGRPPLSARSRRMPRTAAIQRWISRPSNQEPFVLMYRGVHHPPDGRFPV